MEVLLFLKEQTENSSPPPMVLRRTKNAKVAILRHFWGRPITSFYFSHIFYVAWVILQNEKKLYHPPFKSPFRTDQQKDKHLHTAQLYNCLSVVIYNPSWNCWYLLIVVNFHSLWLNLCVCFMCVLAWINSGQFWKVCRFISRQIAYLFFVKLKQKS